MSRYIDADKLIEAIEDSIGCINFSSPYQDDNDAIVEGMERIKSIVDDTPTVDAVPVVHGRVETTTDRFSVYHQNCSECDEELEWKAYPNYCPNCGAKLDGKEETESAICGTTGLECIRCNPSGCDHRMEKQ